MAKIILIEDNEQLRAQLAARLGTAGHEVWPTADAAAAIAQAERQPADVVITDVMTPNQQALAKLLAGSDGSSAPELIAMSAAPHSPVSLQAARQLGWARMLAKPFHADTLVELVDRLVAHRRYRGAWASLRDRIPTCRPAEPA